MDFGKFAEYMAIGYAAMAIILGSMIAWIYLRFRALLAQQEQIGQLEAEVAEEREAHKAPAGREPVAEGAAVTATEEA